MAANNNHTWTACATHNARSYNSSSNGSSRVTKRMIMGPPTNRTSSCGSSGSSCWDCDVLFRSRFLRWLWIMLLVTTIVRTSIKMPYNFIFAVAPPTTSKLASSQSSISSSSSPTSSPVLSPTSSPLAPSSPSPSSSSSGPPPPKPPPKPFWISMYPMKNRDLVTALVNRLMTTPVDAPTTIIPAAARGLSETCVLEEDDGTTTTMPGMVTCATMYPITNYFGDWNPTPHDDSMSQLFQSQAIMVLSNPIESIPEYTHARNLGPDYWLDPEAIVEWASILSAWKTMPPQPEDSTTGGGSIGLYLAYEDLIDPIQGPIATQKLATMLYTAGFTLGSAISPNNSTAMEYVWNTTMQQLLPLDGGNGAKCTTIDEQQSIVHAMRDIQQRYANDTDLVAIFNRYIVEIEIAIANTTTLKDDDASTTNKASIAMGRTTATTLPSKNSLLQLRLDWTNLERTSPLANYIASYQHNCSLPMAYFALNQNGLGSNLHVYGNALCNAMELGMYRLVPVRPWQWLDVEQCAIAEQQQEEQKKNGRRMKNANTTTTNSAAAWQSALSCYFPEAEAVCPSSQQQQPLIIVPLKDALASSCPGLESTYGGRSVMRAAMTEFLFTRVSPLVQQEALRQLQLVFGSGNNNNSTNKTNNKSSKPATTIDPTNLITVHMRWGDKSSEMDLATVQEYIQAIHSLLTEEEQNTTESNVINIFLATEDPEALAAFTAAAPSHWTIYIDEFYTEMLPHRVDEYNGIVEMTRRLKGRPGLVAMGSALVAMQANRFVLTTASNWSRLLDELRKNILDPRCNSCTRMVDLKYGEW